MSDSRLMMNIKGLSQVLLPRAFFQARLQKTLFSILKLPTTKLDRIKTRLNYYNQLKQSFSFDKNEIGPNGEIVEKIGKLPFKQTSYAYDAYALTKYFKDDFLWIKSYGDIAHALPQPSVCKSRPIENASNNIILKLDKNRHFVFVKDGLDYALKKDKLFYRGGIYQDHRVRFFKQNFASKYTDLGHVGKLSSFNEAFVKPKASKNEHMEFKFLLSLEGNDVASNLKWAMSSNSLVFATKLRCETWFMEGTLKDELVFVEDGKLDEEIEYFLHNEKEAREKIALANEYCKQFLDEKTEFYIGLLVLAKYFYLSEQIEFNKEILSLFS